jgi:hypothetical protein
MRTFIRHIADAATEIYQSQEAPVEATRLHALTAIVATIAAYKLPIPSTEVERASDYYIQNCLRPVEHFVGVVNEQIVIDASAAMNMAKAVWESRYAVVHQPTSKEAIATIMTIMGSGNYRIPPVMAETLKVAGQENMVELMFTANEFCKDKDLFGGE